MEMLNAFQNSGSQCSSHYYKISFIPVPLRDDVQIVSPVTDIMLHASPVQVKGRLIPFPGKESLEVGRRPEDHSVCR